MTSVILSGPLGGWRETFVRWGAELRKIAFIFLDDLYWKDWQPEYPTTAAGMTFTNVTTFRARYRELGGSLFISIYSRGDLGGVADAAILFTLPTNVKNNQGVGCLTADGVSVALTAGAALASQGNQVGVYVGGGIVWALGVDRGFLINAEFELETPQTRKAV